MIAPDPALAGLRPVTPARSEARSAEREPPSSERSGDEDFETVLAGKPQRKAEGKVKEAAPDAPAEAPAGETQVAPVAPVVPVPPEASLVAPAVVAPAVPAAVVAEGLPDVGVAAVTDATVQVTPEKPKVAPAIVALPEAEPAVPELGSSEEVVPQPRVVKVSSDQPVASDAPPVAAVQKIAAVSQSVAAGVSRSAASRKGGQAGCGARRGSARGAHCVGGCTCRHCVDPNGSGRPDGPGRWVRGMEPHQRS